MSVATMAQADYSAAVWIDLDEIDMRPASEMRAHQDEDAIREYSENLAKLPPIKVAVDSDGKHWIEDGAHRYQGALLKGESRIRCQIRTVKDYVEAFQAACRANEENRAVRITSADKRHRVEVALKHPVMSGWSNRLIAEHCGVSHFTVNTLRSENKVEESSTSKTVKGKDGKSYPAPKATRKPREGGASEQSRPDAPNGSEPSRTPAIASQPEHQAPEAKKETPSPQELSVSKPNPEATSFHRPEEKSGTPASQDDEDDEGDRDPDMKLWDREAAKITAIVNAWPDGLKGLFLIHAETLLFTLKSQCPGWKQETVSLN